MYIKIGMILDLHLLKTKFFLRNFEAAINTPNTSTISVHDDLTAKNELEQILTQNESTIKLKQNEVISLTEYIDMNKNRLAGQDHYQQVYNHNVLMINSILDMILLDLLLLEKDMLIKMLGWNI